MQLEQREGIHLAYDPANLEGLRSTLPAAGTNLDELLSKLLTGTKLCHQKVDETHFLISTCSRRSFNVSGTLTHINTGERVPFATVSIHETNTGVTSDAEGHFVLNGLVGDSALISVRYIGYQPQLITVKPGQEPLEVKLAPHVFGLDELTVTDYMELIDAGSSFSQMTIETERLRSIPAIGEPDPIRSLRLLPGIGGNPETSTGIAMRGGRGDQTMILFDDFQVFHIDHLFGLFSVINQNAVKDIQVFRSGYSAKYSGFAGGMVSIEGNDGHLTKFAGSASINVFNVNLHFEVPIIKEKWTSVMALRTDNSSLWGDLWRAEVAEPLISEELVYKQPRAEELDLEAGLGFSDVYFKTTFRPSTRNKLSLTVLTSQDSWNINAEVDEDEENAVELKLSSNWSNSGTSFNWHRQHTPNLSGNLVLNASVFFSNTLFDTLLEVVDADTLLDLKNVNQENGFVQAQFRYDLIWNGPKGGQWLGGVDLLSASTAGLSEDFSYLIENDVDSAEVLDILESGFPTRAIYLEHRRTWRDRWDTQIGLRGTTVTGEGGMVFEPRMSLRYLLKDGLYLRSAYGRYQQYAKQFIPDLRAGLVPDFWFYPENQASFPIKADQLSVGFSRERKGWLFDGELYFKYIRNTAEQYASITELYPANQDVVTVLYVGSSTVKGADLMVRKRFKKLSMWLGIEGMDVKNETDSISTGPYQPEYASRGTFRSGFLFQHKAWEFGATWVYIAGRTFTPLDSLAPISNLAIGTATLPAYHRLDLSANYAFSIKRYEGRIRANVFNTYNFFNTRQINHTFDRGGIDDAIRSVEVGGLGRLFNLSFEMRF